jgi:cell division protein FtsQ
MLRSERGAAITAGHSSARIYSMEELRRSHGRRLSCSRGRRQEDTGAYRHVAAAFREKDDSFVQPRRVARRQEAAPRPALQSASKRRYVAGNSLHLVDWQQQHHDQRKKKSHRLLMAAVLLCIACIAVPVVLSIYKIRTIEVKGIDSASSQSIAALSGINMGDCLLFANLSQARFNIESDPQFEVLQINKIFPAEISIEIRQRKPHAAIACLGSYIVIDEKGFVLDIRNTLPAGQYPLVTGVEVSPAPKGKTLTGTDPTKFAMMCCLLNALYAGKALQYLSEVHIDNSGTITLVSSAGIEIDMGKATDLEKKAEWIAGIVPDLHERGYTSGILYITAAKNPIFSATDGQTEQAGAESGVQGNGNSTDSSSGNAA